MTNEPKEQSEQVASKSKPRNFVTLDALRGVAAFPVLYLHVNIAFGGRLFPHGNLAVDFFFLLSGFVMTYVYQERLDAGWSAWSFFAARVKRLYPLYFLGTLAGIIFSVLQYRFGKLHMPLATMMELALLNLCFIPAPPFAYAASVPLSLYIFNVPAWSLFYELIANLIHALFFRRRVAPFLLIVVGVSGAFYLWLALRVHMVAFGPNRSDYLYTLCRVLFSYPLGMLLFKAWQRNMLKIKVHPVWVGLALLVLLGLPVASRYSGVYEWCVVAFAFPLLLMAGAWNQPAGHYVRVSQWLGAISYPIYILHVPLFAYFEQVWVRVTRHDIVPSAPWAGCVFLVVATAAAYVAGEHYDVEARKLLSRRPAKAIVSEH